MKLYKEEQGCREEARCPESSPKSQPATDTLGQTLFFAFREIQGHILSLPGTYFLTWATYKFSPSWFFTPQHLTKQILTIVER